MEESQRAARKGEEKSQEGEEKRMKAERFFYSRK